MNVTCAGALARFGRDIGICIGIGIGRIPTGTNRWMPQRKFWTRIRTRKRTITAGLHSGIVTTTSSCSGNIEEAENGKCYSIRHAGQRQRQRKQRHQYRSNQRGFSSSSSSSSSFRVTMGDITEEEDPVVRIFRSGDPANRDPYDIEKEELTILVDNLLLRTRALMDGRLDGKRDGDNGDNVDSEASTSASVSAHHVIAFSGGIDSSVAAALVHAVVSTSSSSSVPFSLPASQSLLLSLPSTRYHSESATAVLGISPAVPDDQRLLAAEVADAIGIRFEQIHTTEGSDAVYQANDGRACLACKTHLYDNLKGIADYYDPYRSGGGTRDNTNADVNINATTATATTTTITSTSTSTSTTDTWLYNGTNAEDGTDPTRLGLIAASEFGVRSPLEHLSKSTIRKVGRHAFGLPNWDRAAAPCLRSRLAIGVMATRDHLRTVASAEEFVRRELDWDVRKSLRVRILTRNRAVIEAEVDDENDNHNHNHNHNDNHNELSDDPDSGHWTLEQLRERLDGGGATTATGLSPWRHYFQNELGFASVDVRRFRSGSVAPKIVRSSLSSLRN